MKPRTFVAIFGISILAIAAIYKFQKKDVETFGVVKGRTSKTISFPHDKEIEDYLSAVRPFLIESPTDGRFGYSRVKPLTHKLESRQVPAHARVLALNDGYVLDSFVVGTLKRSQFDKAMNQYRISRLLTERSTGGAESGNIGLSEAVEPVMNRLETNEYETYSQPVKYQGCSGWIMTKPVFASEKDCYRCHSNIQPGRLIGHVVAIRWYPYKDN